MITAALSLVRERRNDNDNNNNVGCQRLLAAVSVPRVNCLCERTGFVLILSDFPSAFPLPLFARVPTRRRGHVKVVQRSAHRVGRTRQTQIGHRRKYRPSVHRSDQRTLAHHHFVRRRTCYAIKISITV